MDQSNRRIELMQEMLTKDPNDPFLNYALALEYKAREAHTEALQRLQQLAQTHPEYLPTYYQWGQLLSDLGQTDEAIAVYKTGKALAKKKGEMKTLGEIQEALLLLDADEE